MSRKKNEETNVNVTKKKQSSRIPKDTLFCIKRNKEGGYFVMMDSEMSGTDFFSVLSIMEAVLDEYNEPEPVLERYPLPN